MTTACGRGVLGLALAAVMLTTPGCSSSHTRPVTGQAGGPTVTAPSATESTPSLASAMRQWEVAAGAHFTASGKALQQVSEATEAEDEAAMQTACKQLHDTNTIGLQQHLPSPDPLLTDQLQRMIDDIDTATHACLRFVQDRHTVDATTYQDYLARAVEHLHRAKGILDADLAPK